MEINQIRGEFPPYRRRVKRTPRGEEWEMDSRAGNIEKGESWI